MYTTPWQKCARHPPLHSLPALPLCIPPLQVSKEDKFKLEADAITQISEMLGPETSAALEVLTQGGKFALGQFMQATLAGTGQHNHPWYPPEGARAVGRVRGRCLTHGTTGQGL